ncbi:DUF2333 family protein [Endozoicomonas gorgoniicola]|uniref:DUF2333 family protein n=1 Tax=Endozoicomonas gorgoniicola TaxID=1234144 RepID=A0ABT3N252_9GAMM|nr:DUF2333 family protein [Endozoicomonas gorgoniicola]MCW7555705.1 DUF2333 family protein [Endozoicomonas gorgoniicola]
MALDEIKERISITMLKITDKLRSCSFSGTFANSLNGIKKKISGKGAAGILAVIVVFYSALGIYWSIPPKPFSVRENAELLAQASGEQVVTGYTTTATLYRLADTLLTKRGGYIRNDIMPPGVFLDNMPNWELGVLIQVRDMARALRKDMSRSQSQSREDPDLAIAEPQFNFDSNSWILPSSEKEYQRGIDKLENYMNRLPSKEDPAQFYARADNLTRWLSDVETRLGSLSQRLSASVGKPRLNTDLAGDAAAQQSTVMDDVVDVKTPWHKIDDIFFESRGTAYALIHLLKAVEIDFADVLEKKNATVSLRQIIRELEATQDWVWSPVILNGSGFGILANHSLVMANYISRANAAIIDLRRLLEQG